MRLHNTLSSRLRCPMNLLRRVFTLSLLLLSLIACEDPFDRIQGEPGEEGVTATATDESGPAESPAAPDEAAGEAEEGH